MKPMREKMFAEALKRMELLGLHSNDISNFENHSKISLTTQICRGGYPYNGDEKPSYSYDPFVSLNPEISSRGYVWEIVFGKPDEELQDIISKAEQKFNGLVYHAHQLKIRHKVHGNMVMNSFLYVSKYLEDWEYEQGCLKKGIVMCISPIMEGFGPDGSFEIGEVHFEIIENIPLRIL